MRHDLMHFTGVSFPRSGHHLLARVLREYFGPTFGYCEFYKPEDCCKSVPCRRQRTVNLSKNHDYGSSVPILPDQNYLIQYRSFLPAIVSNYELHARNVGIDNEAQFRKFAGKQKDRYLEFMNRWLDAEASGATFVRVSYERLTGSPLEILSSLIAAFQPDAPIDREKLKDITDRIDRRSVEKGKESVSPNVGIAAFRDVRDFRYFDEDFFAELDAETKDVFAAAEAMPLIVKVPGTGSSVPAPVPVFERIYVDASGFLRLEGDLATGIPRVQDFIVRQAIADPDPLVDCVYFDISTNSFKPLQQQHLDYIARTAGSVGSQVDPRALWAEAKSRARGNPLLSKEFDRSTALRMVKAVDGIRGKPAASPAATRKRRDYHYYKNTIRMIRYLSKLRGVFRRPQAAGKNGRQKLDGRLLVSHLALSSSLFKHYIDASHALAFVFHDNIPLDHPEYLSNAATSDRIKPKIKRLRHKGAVALCASDYSKNSLRAFDRKSGTAGQPARRFPMPSSLYLQAAEKGRTDRITGAEPFILYCSTIEVRKNHILLARIWKDALDKGIDLPPLYCAGKWGWGVEELSAFMNANPELSSHVKFLGSISDDELIGLYRSAMFSVYPSFLEGWGLGASEALDFGLPVVVSTAEALQEATRGLMPAIDPNDRETWLRQIVDLVGDEKALESLRRKIGDNYRPVTEQESWDAIKAGLRYQPADVTEFEPASEGRSDASRNGKIALRRAGGTG